jgi:hypothetical protein
MELCDAGGIEAGGPGRHRHVSCSTHARALREFLRDRKEGERMPRYFFDVVDDKKIYDKKGVSLPNEKAARQFAITFARELMETKPELMGESWRAWSVQVCNGKFDRILKIPFTEAIATSGAVASNTPLDDVLDDA